MVGKTISHYKILEKLGSGGMGVVYKAQDLKLDRFVALKFLSHILGEDEEDKKRFTLEAKAASALDHNNICTIYEIGEIEDGQSFIAMAYYDGETLKKKIERGALKIEEALDVASQVGEGLAKAHKQDIVHRDIKPANIMMTNDGMAKIVDFGLAMFAGSTKLTKSGTIMGTVAYMSPEQTHGEDVDHRTDIWSLGLVLYEMLTGQLPFKAKHEVAVIYSILNEEPEPISALRTDIPVELERIVNKAMHKGTSERYQNMDEMLADLKREQKNTTEIPKRKRVPLANARRNRKFSFGMAGTLIMASVFLLLLLLTIIPSFRHLVLPGSAPEPRRLAVLPFRAIGGNPINEAFHQGLLYTVTNILMKEPFHDAVQVISANEVLDAGITNTRQADSTFGVDRTMTGSIEHTGNSVSLTLTLVDAASLTGLNSLIIYAQEKNKLAYQDKMVEKLAELLGMKLNLESIQTLTAGGTREPGAYEFYLQGQGYLQQFTNEAQVDAAISLFERAIAADSSYALAYAGIGEAYLRKYEQTKEKDWIDKAFQFGERAIALDSQLSPVHFVRGLYYKIKGRHEEAIDEFHRALELAPNNASTYRSLATAHEKLNELDLAEKSYKKAVELKPEYWAGYNNLGIFYHNLGRHAEAAQQFRHVTELVPDNAWGYNNLGAQYQAMMRYDEAISCYEKATVVNTGEVEARSRAYFNIGTIYYAQDHFSEAVRSFKEGLRLQENHIWGWHMLANANSYAGEDTDARAAWKRAIALAQERLQINPSHAQALQVLAGANAMLGEREQALVAIDRLLAMERKDAKLLEMVGLTYEVLGERDLALHYIEEALKNGLAPKPLETSKWLKNLRTDPRYKKLITLYMSEK